MVNFYIINFILFHFSLSSFMALICVVVPNLLDCCSFKLCFSKLFVSQLFELKSARKRTWTSSGVNHNSFGTINQTFFSGWKMLHCCALVSNKTSMLFFVSTSVYLADYLIFQSSVSESTILQLSRMVSCLIPLLTNLCLIKTTS